LLKQIVVKETGNQRILINHFVVLVSLLPVVVGGEHFKVVEETSYAFHNLVMIGVSI
jgi:hypothetical protein